MHAQACTRILAKNVADTHLLKPNQNNLAGFLINQTLNLNYTEDYKNREIDF